MRFKRVRITAAIIPLWILGMTHPDFIVYFLGRTDIEKSWKRYKLLKDLSDGLGDTDENQP